MEETKAAEAGDGLEARRCGRAPRTTQGRAGGEGERRGEGGRGPTEPKPQPGLTPATCGEGESHHGGRTAGQTVPSYEY